MLGKKEDEVYEKVRFISKYSQKNLYKLWFPFLKNMYCRYTSNILRKERCKINWEFLVEYEKLKKIRYKCWFQYKEYSKTFPQPIALTYDHVPLYESALYTNMLKKIPKCVRGDKDIFDCGFYPLLEE